MTAGALSVAGLCGMPEAEAQNNDRELDSARLRGRFMEDLKWVHREMLEADEDLRAFKANRAIRGLEASIPVDFRDEHIPRVSPEVLAQRLKALDTEIPMTYNRYSKSFIDYYTIRDRAYSRQAMSRKSMYFPIFERKLREHGLPDELKYLAVVESGLKPRVMSRAGAIGLWQFMSRTGKYYGLSYDHFQDERMDPEKSTEAACRYLKDLYMMFGDWELALAAYNCGPGNVRKAIRRSDYKRNFWQIYRYLPRETRSYLPQFIALTYTFKHAEEHNLVARVENHPIETDTVRMNGFVNLKVVANLIGTSMDSVSFVNPSLKYEAIPDSYKNYVVNLPVSNVDYFRQNRTWILDSASNVDKKRIMHRAKTSPASIFGRDLIYYRVKRGDVLGSIAIRYGVKVRDLRNWNSLRGNMIRVGQRLRIYTRGSVASKYRNSKSSAKKNVAPRDIPSSRVHYVKQGESLWSISRMYKNVSVEKIKKLNGLKRNNLKPGQKLYLS
ncbi:hypothetical protein FUAX_37410 [Fulvitalea axinellae]|uniref:LysM domain-containing protein n=2 Tax=Fulvitalea axinellae TaxID=1182444 RepID=A0AAU9CGJ9_9BACT|nr:hypothetical protein FUAX_37410 [Fulvitalea axinellae]